MELKQTIDLTSTLPKAMICFNSNADVIRAAMRMLQQHCHAASYNRGWWTDPITGLSLIPGGEGAGSADAAWDHTEVGPVVLAWFPYVIGTKIALIHSETSEALEAYRTGATDDKIPFPGITAEGGDSMIRWFDLLGCLAEYEHAKVMANLPLEKRFPYDPNAGPVDYDVGEAIMAKLPVNVGRPDHDLAMRRETGGKLF